MKFFSIAAVLLLMFGFGRTAHAQYPTGAPGDVCKATNNLEAYMSTPIDHETCVLLVNTAEHKNGAEASATCKFVQAQGGLQDMSVGECVRALQSAHDFGATSRSLEVFGVLLFGWLGVRVMQRRALKRAGCAPCGS